MDVTIGNQQVKPEELAWLAGFWDGEGSITVFQTKRRNKTDKYNASLVLTNTDEHVILHTIKLLDRFGINLHLFKRVSNTEKHKDSYQLTTRNMVTIKKILTLLLPYLVCKKAQAELTLRYIDSRLKNLKGQYKEEEIDIYKEIKKLNLNGKSSEAIRQDAQCV